MRRFLITFPIALTLFAGAAAPAYAAVDLPILNPQFTIVPMNCLNCPCTLGGVLALAQNLINAGIAIGILAAVAVMVYAGASFMLNPTKPDARTQARKMLINVFIGLLIVLAAWLLVDFIMKTLYNSGSAYGPWNSILVDTADQPCIQERDAQQIANPVGAISQAALTGTNANQLTAPSSAQTGPGTCPEVTSGPCSVSNLTAFGSAAVNFSEICYNESRGLSVPSTVDVGTDGQPVSFGLFQINISATAVNGLNCPAAFSAPYVAHNANGTHVINQSLYNQCKSEMLDPNQNIQFAAALYNKSGFAPWHGDEACGGF